MTQVTRTTRETEVRITLEPGAGRATVATGVRFLDHMLATLARCAALDLAVQASGDLRHHVIEDVALALGEALRASLAPAIARWADRTVAMDDALVQAALDLGGRPYYRGPLPSRLYDHWMRSFADSARLALHVRVLRGRDRHHVVEAAFKALGLALREAMRAADAPMTTKGEVSLEVEPC